MAEGQAALEQLVSRYAGTPAGTQGVLRLAQVLYEQGKHQEGVDRLEQALEDHGSGPFQVAMLQLAAAGYESLGRPADAAVRYVQAAEETDLEGEGAELRARAARAFGAAGNKAEAIRLWEELLAEGGPLTNEARIRLGELRTTAAGTG
jgi:predicted negative regulator of RcsB-dependent stress response